MDYRIGEVAKLFNLSRELLRYYERCGAITPKRLPDNDYRVYDTMDVFYLMELLGQKAWGVKIKDIRELTGENYDRAIAGYLETYRREAKRRIAEESLRLRRAEELLERGQTAAKNLGNYWVKRLPGRYLFHLIDAEDETYAEPFRISQAVQRQIMRPEMLAMTDSLVLFEPGLYRWEMALREDYLTAMADAKTLEQIADGYLPPGDCFCTVIRMGEIGSFDDRCLSGPLSALADKGFVRDEAKPASGVIIARNREASGFRRLMALEIPIEP